MPSELRDKLLWLFVLLPGFLSLTLIGFLYDLGPLSEFETIYFGFVLTLVNNAITALFFLLVRCLIPCCQSAPQSAQQGAEPTTSGWCCAGWYSALLLCISIITGIGIGIAREKDVFFIALRSLPITETINKRSSSRPLVFLLSQNTVGKLKEEGDARPHELKTTEAWVRVQLKDAAYEGWPEFYSTGNLSSELYLSPGCKVEDQSGQQMVVPLKGPGVLIFEKEIQSVELLDRKDSPCSLAWTKAASSAKAP